MCLIEWRKCIAKADDRGCSQSKHNPPEAQHFNHHSREDGVVVTHEVTNVGTDRELILSSSGGDVVFKKPVVYQRCKDQRSIVPSQYAVKSDGSVGFVLGKYDKSRELVIDPILSYSSLLWGSSANGVAVDSAGNTYIAGYLI